MPETVAPITLAQPAVLGAAQHRARRRLMRLFSALVLPAILFAAVALRVHDLTRHSFWSDEVYTLETSAGHGLANKHFHVGWVEKMPDLLSLRGPDARPWWAVMTSLVRDDNHPPLYFLLARWWRELFGDSDAAVRALSLLFSVLTIPLVYDAVKQLHGLTAARWAAVLIAVAGPQIQYAQEARAYALLVLLGAAACAVMARIERYGVSRPRLVLLAAAALAMMWTHYYAIAPLSALAVYAMIRLRHRGAARVIGAFAVAAGIFVIAWGWAVWRQRLNIAGNNWYIIETSPDHLARTLRRVVMTPIEFLFDPMRRAATAASLASVLYVIPLMMCRRRPGLLLWGLWLTFTVGFVLGIDLLGHSRQLEFMRYTIAASPAVCALVAALLADQKRWWMRHALPALAALGCVLSLGVTYQYTQTPKPDWRIPAAVINAHLRDGDVFYFAGYERDPGVVNSLMLAHYVPRLPRTMVFSTGRPDPATLARLRRATGVWTVVEVGLDYSKQWMPGFVPSGRPCWVFGLPVVQRWTPVAMRQEDLGAPDSTRTGTSATTGTILGGPRRAAVSSGMRN